MKLSELRENALTDETVHRLLFGGLEYRGDKAELIAVLGSRKACEYRVPVAAELYREGKAERLLFCGGKVQSTKYGVMPEFRSMLAAAAELSIPRGAILTEERSLTTAENLVFSREIIAERMPCCRRIILVTAAYHMRRAMMLAERILPEYDLIPCPANKGSARRDNWRLTEKGRRTAREEVMKLKYCAENGFIEDKDFDI